MAAKKRVAKRSKTAAEPPSSSRDWLRPQSVVFTLLAEHVLDRELALYSGSFIEVLKRVGVGEHATRSTLARMVRRGLLARMKRGRKIYLRMTPRCAAILEDGRQRIWNTGAVNRSEASDWTLLTFSMPESWRRERYDLRSRLAWAGFGPLQNGAWIAPAEVDVRAVIAELKLTAYVNTFTIRATPPTDPAAVIRTTFDVAALSQRYRAFCTAVRRAERESKDALVLTLRLSTQWLRIIRDDPRVPVHLLPSDWPAIEAQRLYRSLHDKHRPAADLIAASLLDTLPL
jgi:phenylacetic acid degradation operon negative regulatory protein